jgi:hypothetical protein
MQRYIRKGAENVQVLGTFVACYNRIVYICKKKRINMEKYFFFSVIVFDFDGRFKSYVTGTLLSNKYPSFADVSDKALKGKRLLSSDTVVLAGLSEISKDFFDSFRV